MNVPSYPQVPRSSQEWSEAFQNAQEVESAHVYGLEYNSAKPLITGESYVAIKPGGNRRDDPTTKDKTWVARTMKIARSAQYGTLVKLHWFYTPGEPEEDMAADGQTRKFIASTGSMELISLASSTIDFADVIDRVLPVVSMPLTSPQFPIISSDTLYFRDDFTLLRSETSGQVKLMKGSGQSICSGTCVFYGRYSPDKDILRFCLACGQWYHTCCIPLSDAQRPTLAPPGPGCPPQPPIPDNSNDLEPMFECKFTAAQYRLWKTLLQLPIQRGVHGVSYPLSFEYVVYDIRTQERNHGCPDDVFDFINHHLHVPSHLKDRADTFRGALFEMLTDDTYYDCPGCDSAI
ncbi:hypothetical protein BC628DRAFT_1342575 [Trametes gibbosa]|nr:hypothetical protein BC628DRAFT_1342575 [Trametes gibbosa]